MCVSGGKVLMHHHLWVGECANGGKAARIHLWVSTHSVNLIGELSRVSE